MIHRLYTDTHNNKVMARGGYTSVCIPRRLLDEVDQILEKGGYSSRAEFVKEAVRKNLKELHAYSESKSSENNELPVTSNFISLKNRT